MAVEDGHGLDAVVANAGVNLVRSIDETTDDDIDRLLAINVRAVIYLAQATHRALAEASGSFVVMASKTGLVAQPDSPLYCATKGAAVQLARALALDWAGEGIRVNAVCPGIVDTPMLDGIIAEQADPDRVGPSSSAPSRSGASPARPSAPPPPSSSHRRRPPSSAALRFPWTAASRPSEPARGSDGGHNPRARSIA